MARYELDLVGVQEVRWEKEGTVKARDYSFFLMLNAIDFPGGRPTNNNSSSSGNDGHPTTSRAFNSVIGDLALLREDNMTPLQWPTGVITYTHAGKDAIVRVVTLRTTKGTFKRPTTKICPLPRGNSEL